MGGKPRVSARAHSVERISRDLQDYLRHLREMEAARRRSPKAAIEATLQARAVEPTPPVLDKAVRALMGARERAGDGLGAAVAAEEVRVRLAWLDSVQRLHQIPRRRAEHLKRLRGRFQSLADGLRRHADEAAELQLNDDARVLHERANGIEGYAMLASAVRTVGEQEEDAEARAATARRRAALVPLVRELVAAGFPRRQIAQLVVQSNKHWRNPPCPDTAAFYCEKAGGPMITEFDDVLRRDLMRTK